MENPTPETLSPDAVQQCIDVLSALQGNRNLLSGMTQEKRRELLTVAGLVSRPSPLERSKRAKAHRRARKVKERVEDREARATVGIRQARRSPVFIPPPQLLLPAEGNPPAQELKHPRSCYVCKAEFTKLHFFYDAMCGACGDLNYAKRFQTAPLDGRVAIITGARVKIGFQAALMMLRAGAEVIVTTRFPRDAAARYAREADFSVWGHRVHVHGLDLRHSPSVEIFCQYVCHRFSRLDFLVNNAAQTVRRPPGFYAHLLEVEARPVASLPEAERRILDSQEEMKGALTGVKALPTPGTADSQWMSTWHRAAGIGVLEPAVLSQVPYDFTDGKLGAEVFPSGALDADLQQVDLRGVNSWRLKLADVPTPEMLEVQLVNSIAPFILCAKLKPLMLQSPTGDRHVVNVTAMEGIFSRHTKTDKHPHTNMAKAALNMMTLTSAPDYAKDGIFMNAVDTGWVTDEDPVAITLRKQAEMDFHPPLDIVDGAARVCDPFFAGLNTGVHVWGKFLKDYRPANW